MTDETKELYPNVYKVTYREMEANEQHRGMVTKVTYLEDINMLLHYRSKILGIQPVYAQFLPELSSEGIEMLIQSVEHYQLVEKQATEAKTLEREIQLAQAKLAKLRGE